MKTQKIVDYVELPEDEMIRLRGGYTVIEVGLTLAMLVVVGGVGLVQIYYDKQQANAADLANEIELAKLKYQNDPMSLTERQRDLLGLNNNIPVVNTSHLDVRAVQTDGSFSYDSTPPEFRFIVPPQKYESFQYQYDQLFGGGGGGNIDVE